MTSRRSLQLVAADANLSFPNSSEMGESMPERELTALVRKERDDYAK